MDLLFIGFVHAHRRGIGESSLRSDPEDQDRGLASKLNPLSESNSYWLSIQDEEEKQNGIDLLVA